MITEQLTNSIKATATKYYVTTTGCRLFLKLVAAGKLIHLNAYRTQRQNTLHKTWRSYRQKLCI
jgi:hypothetical protein